MKLRTAGFLLIPAFCCGVLLTFLIGWVTPFSESVTFDIVYLALAFGFGVLLRKLLKVKLPKAVNLVFVMVAALLLLKGQTFLYFLTTNFYWGWSVLWLLGLIIGILYQSGLRMSAVLSFVSGLLGGYLLFDNSIFIYVLIISLLVYLWQVDYRIAFKIMVSVLVLAVTVLSIDEKVPLSKRQKKFSDLIIFSDFTRENKIDVTTWKGNYWYYVNDQNRLSSVDDYLYHEPMVHPAITFHKGAKKVLILGGELGGTIREVCKYDQLEEILVVPEDYDLIAKVKDNRLFDGLSGNAWNDPRIKVVDWDLLDFLEKSGEKFDVIISDLPDPNTLLRNQYYTVEFFKLCAARLNTDGTFVTQAGSPYFATKAYYSIIKTMNEAGFYTVPFHNQILTMGEWGWVLGAKENITVDAVAALEFSNVPVNWINQEAMKMMLSFGKITVDTTNTQINTIKEPVTHRYYTAGNWSF
ncbi:MAG: hypothetical protein AAFQ94_24710 [Bacteroidota bacterium]